MQKIGTLIGILILMNGWGSVSWAISRLPDMTANLEVIYTDDTHVDLATKIWMIEHAQKSVEISAFIFGQDDFGLNIARALRVAMNRGVDVRVLYESIPSMVLGNDPLSRISDLLTDPRLKKPAQVLNMSLLEKMRGDKLALNDYLHEKFFIIDAGTVDEKIYFGGRDLSGFSRLTVDSGYFIRPLDFKSRYVGNEIKKYYDGLWDLLKQNFTLSNATVASADKALEVLSWTPEIKWNIETLSKVAQITNLLKKTPSEYDILAENQFRPASASFVANNFLRNVLAGHYEKTFAVRRALVTNDPISKLIGFYLDSAKRVQISAYSSDFSNPLRILFGDFVKNGQLIVYTNGPEAMSSMDKLGISELAFDYSLSSILSLQSLENSPEFPHVYPYGLDLNKTLSATKGRQSYLHRKLMLIDDRFVITGSYNFTNSSSGKNDEFVVTFDDPRMNYHHTRMNDRERNTFYSSLTNGNSSIWYKSKRSVKSALLYDFVKSQY